MILRALRKLHRDQQGFTLIELLVVITVIGVMAAIVTVSLLGVTSTARKNALKAEKQTVQTAFDAMLHDQHVDQVQLSDACPHLPWDASKPPGDVVWQDDMTKFPVNVIYQTPKADRQGVVVALSTHYLRETFTNAAKYSCDSDGNIYQQEKK